MIRLSKQVEYTIEFLLALGRKQPGEILSVKIFSGESNISYLFLQRIALRLKSAGIIKAVRGTKGGYMLEKSIEHISLKEVYEIVEGKYGSVACQKGKECKHQASCNLKIQFDSFQEKILSYMESIPLQNFYVSASSKK